MPVLRGALLVMGAVAHFLSCQVVTQDRRQVFTQWAEEERWDQVLSEARTIMTRWCSFFSDIELSDYARGFCSGG